MCSGIFRGKESSNRIEIFRLVQDLLNFGVLGSLWLWEGCRWVGMCLGASGGMGGVPTHVDMHAHTHMHACICIHIEIANGCPHGGIHVYHVYNMHVHAYVCVCVHACVCMHGAPHTHPHPPAAPGISKNSITLELIKIIQFCLKI